MRLLALSWLLLVTAVAKEYAMKTVLVTGGSGFLGRSLVRDMAKRGIEVKALARTLVSKVTLASLGAWAEIGDLTNLGDIRQTIVGCDTVIHAAADTSHNGRLHDAISVNIEGTRNLMEAAKAGKVRRVVFIGAPAALIADSAEAVLNATEEQGLPLLPFRGAYSTTKNQAERIALSYNSPTLEVIVARPGRLWGRDDSSLLPLLQKASRYGFMGWLGRSGSSGASHRVSTCHVANAVHGVLRAAQAGRAGETYHFTDGEPVVFGQFADRLLGELWQHPLKGVMPLQVSWAVAHLSEGMCRMSRLCTPFLTRETLQLLTRELTVHDGKARRELGYQPPVSLELGMRSFAEAYRHHEPTENHDLDLSASGEGAMPHEEL